MCSVNYFCFLFTVDRNLNRAFCLFVFPHCLYFHLCILFQSLCFSYMFNLADAVKQLLAMKLLPSYPCVDGMSDSKIGKSFLPPSLLQIFPWPYRIHNMLFLSCFQANEANNLSRRRSRYSKSRHSQLFIHSSVCLSARLRIDLLICLSVFRPHINVDKPIYLWHRPAKVSTRTGDYKYIVKVTWWIDERGRSLTDTRNELSARFFIFFFCIWFLVSTTTLYLYNIGLK